MSTFTITVADGIASLYDETWDAVSPPLAEGFGETNDCAVADLISKVTFDAQ